ncbi:hypothetical protein QUC31_019665 [Theobroma cacao]
MQQLLQLFQDKHAANLARQEAINARLDEFTMDLAASKVNPKSTEKGSNNRSHKGKGVAKGTGSETTRRGAIIPKFTKLNFPRFNGQEDSLGWLCRCKHFFCHQQTPEEEKVNLASFHLEGNAQLWFLQMEVDTPQPSWDEFKRQCHLRFGPPIRSHKLGELAKLRQSGTVADYQEKFEQLASQASTLTQAQKIELYISGLAEHIAVKVELHNLSDLATAMSISRLYERKGQPTRTPISEVPQSKPPDTPLQHRTRFVKKLTKVDMEERQLKGLCFNCDEPYVRGHQCKKLFWIDSVEGDEKKTEYEPPANTDQPKISLNAIIGISTPQNMSLQGKLKVKRRDGLRVVVANGERIRSLGRCEGMLLQLGNHTFFVDLYVLTLSSFDVILGVNWLKTLGPILWDFTDMWMSFTKLGKQIELYGIKTSKPAQSAEIQVVTVEDYHADLQRLLAGFVSLFQEPTGHPPSHACDHRIILEPGTKPIVVRPYRYPHA